MADFTPGLHTVIYCLVDGLLFTRETSITGIEQVSGSSDVKTVALGYSGVTPGSAMCTVTIENSLPADDMEYNPTPLLRTNAVVELGAIVSGRQMVGEGVPQEGELQARRRRERRAVHRGHVPHVGLRMNGPPDMAPKRLPGSASRSSRARRPRPSTSRARTLPATRLGSSGSGC